jgi:CRISPR/Cas system-associated exonuclease Cas4 (RecB family)
VKHGADAPALPRVLRALADAARAYPLERKLLVCARPAHGRELLRALAHAGIPWIGFDVTTPAQLASELVAPDIAAERVRPTDEFDELALLDDAMDEVLGSARDGLAELAEGFGLRQAIVHAVRALRLAGVGEAVLERARFRDEQKRAQIARILSVYERGLATSDRLDTAGALRRAVAALAVGTVSLPYDRVYILPGQARRGLAGQLLAVLLERGAELLHGDPVFGLPLPAMWLERGPIAESADARAVVTATPLSWLHAPADVPENGGVDIRLFTASSTVSELREVLRRVIAAGLRWDEVEIVATDATAYGVALDTLARRLGIPVSYAVGLPIARTRPGRAVATYLEWIQTGFPAGVLRQMLERGDIAPPHDSGVTGTALARLLRALKIGRGRDRYRQELRRRERVLATPQPAADERSPGEFAEQRARERAELAALVASIGPLLEATPAVPERSSDGDGVLSPADLARGLLALLRVVPAVNAVDNTAKKRLLERIERMAATLDRPTTLAGAIAVVTSKLDDRVPAPEEPGTAPWTASGGYLHLSDIEHGGYSCRRATFIVGLDAARFPGSRFRDALLVDDDRRRIASGAGTAALPTAAERIEERRYGFAALLARLRGLVTFSYAAWDAVEGRAVAPASELLQVYRLSTRNPIADYDALHAALAPAASPIPHRSPPLDADDVWLGALAHAGRLRDGRRTVYAVYPGLLAGARAHRQRADRVPSPRHGVVQPRPGMDPRDDPGRTISATQLQTLGTCPHRYLLRYVLNVRKPDDPELSTEEWLTPLDRGALMHTVYERALSAARDERLALSDAAFEQRVLDILAEETARHRELLPPPGEAIYRMECELLAEDARAFVAMVREDGDRYIALERKFGRDGSDPVAITLPDGRVLRVTGAIDRVDRLEDGDLVIVDYKTGKRTRFDARHGPYDGGRRLQHVIYAAVARTLFDAEVARAEFHFPTRVSENYRASFDRTELRAGLAVVSQLLDLAARGHFVPTNDPEDCAYCDFAAVCRVRQGAYGKPASPLAEWARHGDADILDTLRDLRRRS